jgi:hypothetical protein
MKKAFRHGEIGFIVIDSLPENLEPSKNNIIVEGSHGNNHSFKGGVFYPKNDDYIIGYFKAEKTILLHADHGDTKGPIKEAKLPDGFYEVRKQKEFINNELKPVID